MPVASVNNLSTEELEAILIHELAHIRRNDYLLNIIQTIVETILFFNPFAWLISAQIRKEREYCCDDEVLTYTHYPIPYAKALANLEIYRTRSLAMAASGGPLFNRIKRIVEMKKQPVNYGYLGLCLLLVAGITISAICFTPSFAQSKKDEKGTKAKTVTKSKVVIIDSNGKKTVYNDMDMQNDMDDMGKNLSQAFSSLQNIDTNKLKAGIAEAMTAVDWDKIGDNFDVALNGIKWDEISKGIDIAMDKIDWDAINDQVQTSMEQSMKEIKDPAERAKFRAEMDKAKAEISKARDEISRELSEEKRKQIRIELDQAKADVAKSKAEVARELNEEKRQEMHTQMAQARITMDSARAHIAVISTSNMKMDGGFDADKLVKKMLNDGLIDNEDGYSIRKEGNELYVNGELQDDVIYKKYRPYMNAKKIVIKGKNDKLNIKVKQ